MFNSIFNRTGKKLKVVNAQIDERKKEIEGLEEQLKKVKDEIRICDQDTAQLYADIDVERREQNQAEEENSRLAIQADKARAELAELRVQIVAAQEAADAARNEKEALLSELRKTEDLVHKEHEAAEVSAESARKHALQLQVAQEAERERWKTIRQQHEELKQQLDASAKQRDHAREQRDEAKVAWMAACDELADLQRSHQRLQKQCADTEAELTQQREERTKLENELAVIDEQHRQILASHKELEDAHRNRQGVLKTVNDDLQRKQSELQLQLKEFEERFETAKEIREKTMKEHDLARDSLSKFLPEYFQLQTEQTSKRRELEHAKREHEILNWEHHKVNRDLVSLSRSYDPAFNNRNLQFQTPQQP